jgi:Protein of unknown function (DUF2971)
MAEVQAPIVPTRLYRYRSLTRSDSALDEEINSIQQGYLFCSYFSRMNDPMEGFYRPSRILQGQNDYKKIIRKITNSKSGIGIACLSETYDNILMWAHYAGNYTGVCFGYSAKKLLKGLPGSAALVRLSYVDQPPLIYPSHTKDATSAARRILSQKQYNWFYEREWRVLASVGIVSHSRQKALSHIYFGSRTDPQHQTKILNAIRGKDIKAYKMDVDGYDRSWEEVKIPSRPIKKSGAS